MKVVLFLFIYFGFLVEVQAQEDRSSNAKDYVVLEEHIPLSVFEKSDNDNQRYKAALNYLINNKLKVLTFEDQKLLLERALAGKALLMEIAMPDEFVSDVVFTTLEPGSKSIKLYLAAGLPVSIIFKDTKGNPVNVYSADMPAGQFRVYKPKPINNNTSNVVASAVASNDTSVDEAQNAPKHFMPNNVLRLGANVVKGGANLPVYTTYGDLPMSFHVIIDAPKDKYVDRLVVIVGNEDPGFQSNDEGTLKTRDALMRVLNDLPPASDAVALNYGPEVRAWESDGFLWLRTRHKLVYPIVSPSSKIQSNGVFVYKAKKLSVVTVEDSTSGKHKRISMEVDFGE